MLIKTSVTKLVKIFGQFQSRNLSTVNNGEIEKFRALAAEMWNTEGPMKALHSLNKLRLQLVKGELEAGKSQNTHKGNLIISSLNFLDVGCGGGILSEKLSKMGANIVGIDPCSDMIEVAKLHASLDKSLTNLEYFCTNVEEHLLSKKNYYDVIIASEVLEHTNDPRLFVKTCCSGLKPGGSIFFTTINRTTASWIGSIIIAEKFLNILPNNTHDWEKYIKPQELKLMLEDNGCQLHLMQGMFYNVLNNMWYFTPYMGINYAIHAVKNCRDS